MTFRMFQRLLQRKIQSSAVILYHLTQSLSFFVTSSAFMFILSRTGFIYVVNYETQETVVNFKVAKEIYSAALLCGGKMIVTGDKEHLYFNEVETGKQIGIYRDIHSDVINHICPHPVYPTVFASGSEDGLVYFAVSISF